MKYNIKQRDNETGLLETIESILDYEIEIEYYTIFWFIKCENKIKKYFDCKEVRKSVREKAEEIYKNGKDTYIEVQKEKYISTDRGPRQFGFHSGDIIWKNGNWID